MPPGAGSRSLSKMRVRLLALISALVLASLWASPRGVAYLCSMDGERRATCCCARDGEATEQDHGRIERAACCEVERETASAAPGLAAGQDEAVQLASVSRALSTDDNAPAASADVVPALARGPPRAGPAPYLRNRRLLI